MGSALACQRDGKDTQSMVVVSMNELLNAIGHSVTQNLGSIGVGTLVIAVALVHNMPEKLPTSIQDFWTWLRGSLQTAIPVRRP